MDVTIMGVITVHLESNIACKVFFLLSYQLVLWHNKGNSHFSAYKQLNFSWDVTIIWLCNISTERHLKNAARWGGNSLTTAEEVLSKGPLCQSNEYVCRLNRLSSSARVILTFTPSGVCAPRRGRVSFTPPPLFILPTSRLTFKFSWQTPTQGQWFILLKGGNTVIAGIYAAAFWLSLWSLLFC